MKTYWGLTPSTSVSLTTPPPKLMRSCMSMTGEEYMTLGNWATTAFSSSIGQVVGIAHALGGSCAAAGIFNFNGVGAELLDEVEDVGLAGHADGDDEDDRCGSDDHAERGEEEARFGGAEAVHGELEDLAEQHGAAGAEQRLLEGAALACGDWIHAFLV